MSTTAENTRRERSRSPTREGASDRERSPMGAKANLPPTFRDGDWMCPGCNAHNYASKTACHKCGSFKEGVDSTTRPDNFREGDWMCPCGAHNYASKMACHKCGTSKMLAGVGSDGNVAKNFRPGDWMCGCGAHNYASKTACHKCGTHKGMAMGGMMGMMGMGGMGGMQQGGMMNKPGNFRAGDWMCQCGAHNYASKTACHKCGMGKQQPQDAAGMGAAGMGMGGYGAGMDMMGGMGGMGAMGGMPGMGAMGGMGGMGAMGGMGMGGMGMGAMGGMGGGMGGGGGQPANFRAGDWMCHCGAHNYASKTACHKCNTAKEMGDSGYGAGAAGAGNGTVNTGYPANFREGDWMCPSCNSHNYASKTACHKCGIEKPVGQM